MRKQLPVTAIGLLAAALGLPALGAFHLMKVVEVFPGTPASPNAQYVVIQMYAAGQNLVGGHSITVFNAAGTQVGTFTFGGSVPNGASQDKLLIATPQAATFFNLTPDLTMSAAVISAGGKVCFDSIDCVAWGTFSGSAAGVGTPYQVAQGLSFGRAAIRRLDISGSASLLDAADDTDDSASDFVEGLPAPRNNLRVNGTIPSAACGNGVIEGLEQCDDSNTSNGDTCSSTCQVTPPPPSLSVADVSVAEGNAGTKLANFSVSLSAVSANPVSFDISTEPGTAMPGVDFTSQSLVNQSIAAGQSSFNFAVVVNSDTEVEDNESFTVNVNNASGAVLLDNQARGTISNDDVPVLSIADATQPEGDSATTGMAFMVSLSRPQPTAVSFNIATSDGTATAGSDYVLRSQVGRTIDAGRTSARFEVTINGDTSLEANEVLNVTLSGVSGATLGDGVASGTIINDETAARVSISAIQGDSLSSPLIGGTVATEGIVTALAADGFFIQSAPGKDDGNWQTSEGIFVLGDPASVRVGDLLTVTGHVEEFLAGGDAQLLAVTRIVMDRVSKLGRGQALPQAVWLDARDLGPDQTVSALEKYEGMRVRVGAMRVVAASGSDSSTTEGANQSGRLFQAVLEGVARPFLEPGRGYPALHATRTGSNHLVFDGNPERLAVDSTAQRGATALLVDGGDTIMGMRGVLDYARTSYRLLLDTDHAPVVLAGATPRPVSMPRRSEATIAAVQFEPVRTRGSSAQFDPLQRADYHRQILKTAQMICAYLRRPDIVALFGASSADQVSDLAAALNVMGRSSTSSASCSGRDDYRVHALRAAPDRAFIVSSKQTRAGIAKIQVLSLLRADGAAALERVRAGPQSAPVVLRVRLHLDAGATRETSIIASRFSPIGIVSIDPGEGSQLLSKEPTRALRMAQARGLAQWLQQRQSENLVVIGDFDAPAFDDGYSDLLGMVSGQPSGYRQVLGYSDSPVLPPMTNLTNMLPADDRYSEVRDGNAQLRNHVLANAAMLSASPRMRVEAARVNADFAVDNRDDPAIPLRSGRIDPIVLYLEPD